MAGHLFAKQNVLKSIWFDPSVFRENKEKIMALFTETNPDKARRYIMECNCGTLEHTIEIVWFPKEKDEELMFLEYHISLDVWYKRIWQAITHIFGKRSRYGTCGELCLTKKDVSSLIEVLQKCESEI